MEIRSLINKKLYIKILLASASILALLSFHSFENSINDSVQKTYSLVRGQLKPDTNIVIIDISKNDIDNLGHWPIKRSYYALLIKSLTDNHVKKIGLSIFLSAKFVTQTIYDNLLTKEIENCRNVVLGSICGSIYLSKGKYYTDSLSFPSPKLLDENIPTGHLNYFGNNEFKIPLVVHDDTISEDAFALKLAQLNNSQNNLGDGKIININFVSSWNKFKRIELLKYFSMVSSGDVELKALKNKFIIIGTSDPQIESSISTVYDNSMPTFAINAFALDNLLKDRSLKDNYLTTSGILFVILIGFLIFIRHKNLIKNYNLFLIIIFTAFWVITFIFYALFSLQLCYSFFLLPFAVIVASDILFFLIEKDILIEEMIDESNILKKLLSNKEHELEKLQEELNLDANNSNSLVEKIKLLKTDIEKLKENEADKKEANIVTGSEVQNFHGIIYKSKSMKSVIDLISKAAPEDANVLILGESGTGKELAAQAIHLMSKRNKNSFIAVNCGALSDTLLESELFGHVKGAFTGAVADKIGRFEAANNGTIFLDEIAETSENFQVKLLRVIQSGDFEKVGSSKSQHTNVRIIAATNKKLLHEVKAGKFREDLYYRLNVIKIELPPLRERREDIETLAVYFLNNEEKEMKLSEAALEALNKYEWKGNVRELEAVIKRAVIFARSSGRKLIQLADLPEEIVKDSKFNFDDIVIESLRSKGFSRSSIIETAKELGNVSRTIVSENFRGYSLKAFVESNFDLNVACKVIANSDEEEIIAKAKNKLNLFLKNIENDIADLNVKDFENVRSALNSKYKNLPHKFHYYLDEIIKRNLS